MRFLSHPEANIIRKLRTTGNYCNGCYFCGSVGGLVFGGGALVVGGVPYHMSDVTLHLSLVMYHILGVTCHTFFLIFFF